MKNNNFENQVQNINEQDLSEDFKQIDRKSPEILSLLSSAPIYKKIGTVKARPANPGEQIVTDSQYVPSETIGLAKIGDWIITNPTGEQYIIPPNKFLKKYEASKQDGIYKSNGYVRAIENPFKKPIEILSEWGEVQTGDEFCLIADTCDENGAMMDNEPYLIDEDPFFETYEKK